METRDQINKNQDSLFSMIRCFAFLLVIMLIAVTGCVAPDIETKTAPVQVNPQLTSASVAEQGTIPAIPTPTIVSTVPATVTATPSPPVTPEKTPVQISESALNARIQDAKNKLDMLKDSDKADMTIKPASPPFYCEIKESKELGYLLDVNTGDLTFVKGDYGSIALDLFRQNMTAGHTYIILHSHAKDWFVCRGSGTISLDTFSLADLSAASVLTEQGYHIQKVIAVGEKIYEVYPKAEDNWKSPEEVYNAVSLIEERMETTFHIDYYNPETGQKTVYYDVDNLMPLLTRELDYTYKVNNVVVA